MPDRDKSPEKPAPAATLREEGSDEPFLKRWSRLKTGEDAGEPEAAGDGAEADGEAPAIDPADLPDIDSLDKDSDYTPFMQEGVPDELRQLALRKLFASNPVFSVLDGLNDYDDDYSTLGIVDQTVRTAYKAGRGFIEDEDLVQIDGEDETEDVEDLDEGDAEAPAEIAEAEAPDDAIDASEDGGRVETSDKDDKPVT